MSSGGAAAPDRQVVELDRSVDDTIVEGRLAPTTGRLLR